MKNMAIILFLLSATICIKTATFGAPPSRHGIGHGRNPVTAKEAAEAKEANEKSKRRIATYLTDEGASGRLTWKEYTVNPKAKGEATLLVVFGEAGGDRPRETLEKRAPVVSGTKRKFWK